MLQPNIILYSKFYSNKNLLDLYIILDFYLFFNLLLIIDILLTVLEVKYIVKNFADTVYFCNYS